MPPPIINGLITEVNPTKIYAIGDIHGCLSSLERLLETVPCHPGDRIVFLGDYIDRGPDSKGVIDHLLHLKATQHVTFLRGNHEEMMLEARNNLKDADFWLLYGGVEMLRSYGLEFSEDWQSGIPSSHWEFLEQTTHSHETDRHIFVHGALDDQVPVADQDPHTLLWGRCHAMMPHVSGKKVICGHTPQAAGRPGVYGFGVCIDTGIYKGQWLTCLDPASGEYWQANEQGDTRRGSVTHA